MRAKVTRLKSDMRNVSVAMEQYFLEYNSYPLDWDSGQYGPRPTSER